MPYALGACAPARGSGVDAGRAYHARIRSRHAGSPRASRRVASAAATYSHSFQVGRRAPSAPQYAAAAAPAHLPVAGGLAAMASRRAGPASARGTRVPRTRAPPCRAATAAPPARTPGTRRWSPAATSCGTARRACRRAHPRSAARWCTRRPGPRRNRAPPRPRCAPPARILTGRRAAVFDPVPRAQVARDLRRLLLRDAAARVAPAVGDVRRDVGHFVVGEVGERRHHGVVRRAVDLDRPRQPVQHHLRDARGSFTK